MSNEKMQIIDDLITSEDICVLATTDGIQPHNSLMHFFADHAAMKFYFLSRKSTQKNKNLKICPHVSMLIDRRDEKVALVIQGVNSPIKKKQTEDAIIKLYLLKHPQMRALAEDPDTELIRILGRSAELCCGFTDVFTTKLQNS
ncbi:MULTISPECIES: pyridoxamine 5'-phosphate oxidase family protein [unclassified Pseudodesulfovibrio]|uniref:pyridoxamine 5'-phosphate oxidase family protein n=1 Tax=unclassified Pseudodesulfovibrio TaxID=2661612 RepID=UPI000FEBCDA4|nr:MULTISPECIES: pyridoxamine 5'-phosphate oxidase family protein [unclassified Pseudodesulfovibrio]MCJ2164469.1 pyridoxamine 5'-phosphate oxidase family protein [Pseudodesulfovibrio sp. S3-i]RWU04778.1 pyridoxamine 5'-phosphate oxidase family protein [Pseudodesulfovibrio sp. S3]